MKEKDCSVKLTFCHILQTACFYRQISDTDFNDTSRLFELCDHSQDGQKVDVAVVLYPHDQLCYSDDQLGSRFMESNSKVKKPFALPNKFLAWIRPAWATSEIEIIRVGGYDAATYIKILSFGETSSPCHS